jgi:hypothetical protein
MPVERVTGRLIERSFEVGSEAELRVNNVRGTVRITGTSTTTIRARLEVDPEHRLSDDEVERAPIEIEHDGHRLAIRVLSDKAIMGWFERRSGPPNVRCVLEVPVRTQSSVSTVSADVSLAGLDLGQTVNTVSGKVVVTEVRGDLRLNTVSGSAMVTETSGAVRWNTVSGDLILRDSTTTELKANSVSGTTEAAIRNRLPGGATVQTVSGDLRLSVPSDFGCEAQLSSMSGNARCALPMRVLESKRGRWRATINGGGPQVRLSSMSGSLYLAALDGAGAAQWERPASQAPVDAPTSSAASDDRLEILRRVERNEITIEEGLARLDALRRKAATPEEVL